MQGSTNKLERAKSVCANPSRYATESVEFRAHSKAVSEGLKDNALLARVVELMGGVMPAPAKKAETKTETKKAKK